MKNNDKDITLINKVEDGQHISPVLPEEVKNYLIDIFRKYNPKKKKLLLKLLLSTENILRNEDRLSTVLGLRFLLSLKKITVS